MKYLSLLLVLSISVIGNAQMTLKAGETAPEIHVTDWFKNPPVDKTLRDRPIVLDFWATWCGSCIAAVPHLNALEAEFADDDILFLAMTYETAEQVAPTLERVDFHSTVVSDTEKRTQLNFGDNGQELAMYPTTVLIDAQNVLRWVGHPTMLTSDILRQFVDGTLEPVNTVSNFKVAGRSTKKEEIKKTEAAPKPRKLMDIMRDGSVKRYFELSETDKNKTVGVNMGVGGMQMGTALQIYQALFDPLAAGDLDTTQYYELRYKANLNDAQSRKAFEMQVIDALNLEKTVTTRPSQHHQLQVGDASKLRVSKGDFSSNSETDTGVVFTGWTIGDLAENLSAKVPGHQFIYAGDDRKRYVFHLPTKNPEQLLKTLESYGFVLRSEAGTEEVVRLRARE